MHVSTSYFLGNLSLPIVCLLAASLGGCVTDSSPTPTIVTVEKSIVEVPPDLGALPKFENKPVNWDYPRKPDGTIDRQSNIAIGLTQDNYNNLVSNIQNQNTVISLANKKLSASNKYRQSVIKRNQNEVPVPQPKPN